MEEEAAYTESKSVETKMVKASYFHLWLLGVFLSSMGILFFFLPKQKVSTYENRNLAQFPQFSKDALMEGTYLDSVDLYYADNFPFRDRFVAFSSWMTKIRGLRSEEVGFYIAKSKPKPVLDTASVSGKDTLGLAVDTALNKNNGGEEMNTNLLIYKGMALDLFGGSLTMEKAYAAAIN